MNQNVSTKQTNRLDLTVKIQRIEQTRVAAEDKKARVVVVTGF
jgi:hypothetical protein